MKYRITPALLAALILLQLPLPAGARVLIVWSPNNEPDFSHYRIYRRCLASARHLATPECIASTRVPRYFDDNPPSAVVCYWVSAVDRGGNESALSGPLVVYPPAAQLNSMREKSSPASPVAEQSHPETTELLLNYPNPFNSATTIPFQIRAGNQPATLVSLQIYNPAGRVVAELFQGYLPSGRYSLSWNGKDEQGRAVSTGTYICRLQAGESVHTRLLILAK